MLALYRSWKEPYWLFEVTDTHFIGHSLLKKIIIENVVASTSVLATSPARRFSVGAYSVSDKTAVSTSALTVCHESWNPSLVQSSLSRMIFKPQG
jgi:hypothetical protein